MTSNTWTQAEAIELCKKIEMLAPTYHCHVALTGGLLYKEGPRKDCDILFYRIRQEPVIDIEGLVNALHTLLNISHKSNHGWVYKFTYQGKTIDAFFPEEQSDTAYPL